MKRILIILLLILLVIEVKAQNTFDSGGGCLNVVDFAYAPAMGKQADASISFNYRHEAWLSDQFSIGVGIGYSHRKEYKLTTIPLYLSTTYFFLDKPFSPYVNMRVGTFGTVSKRNVDTYERFSVSSHKPTFSLFISPSVGLKMHLSPNVGLLLSASYDNCLLKAYDAGKSSYNNKLVGNLGINIGICFQIPGW